MSVPESTEERLAALMAECRRVGTQTPHARFSTALGCLRSHTYDFRLLDSGKWPLTVDRPARWNFAAMTGSAVGWFIEAAAQRLGAKTQHAAELDGIHGELDIEWPDSVWDLKWVGKYQWREAKKAANEKHAAQVNAYAVARAKPKWALIYLPIHSMGEGAELPVVIHEGKADAQRARREVTERWALVEQHRRAGTLPDREVDQATCYRLRCMHRAECWEEGGRKE